MKNSAWGGWVSVGRSGGGSREGVKSVRKIRGGGERGQSVGAGMEGRGQAGGQSGGRGAESKGGSQQEQELRGRRAFRRSRDGGGEVAEGSREKEG